MKELALPAALVLRPEVESAGRHLCVRLIGAVRAAHDTRLAAGRRTGIPRAPGVEQGHTRAAFLKVKRSPSAEGSSSDDGDVRFGFQCLDPIDM